MYNFKTKMQDGAGGFLFLRQKKAASEKSKAVLFGILLLSTPYCTNRRLLLLVTQELQLLLALVFRNLLATFFLQITHFIT